MINTNSPLQLDIPMAEGIVDFAEAGQVLIITPFTLAGAMAPVTITGALTLAHAEALAGITLAQMRAAGHADHLRQLHVERRHEVGLAGLRHARVREGRVRRRAAGAATSRLPWRSSNATASNAPDAQAAYEAQMSLWGALMGGANFMLHAAGWLEGGLSTSYEKFIIDIEMLQMFAELFQPVGAEAVGHGARGHRRGRLRRAFLRLRAHDGALSHGVLHAADLGLAQLRHLVERRCEDRDRTRQHRLPRDAGALRRRPSAIPPSSRRLEAFVERRTAEGGAPPIT